jgi:Spy/CpxP family protein refolding chaperone
MTRKNLPIAFYLLLVFVSGSVVGALGYRTYNPPTARSSATRPSASELRQRYLDESRSRLDLTDDQVAKLAVILDQTDQRFQDVRQRENQEIRQIREEHFARVLNILTAEQRPKYEKLHQERVEKANQQEQQKKR